MINGRYVNALVLKGVPGDMIPKYHRNFGGAEKRDQKGQIKNSFGNRNFIVKFDEEHGKILEAEGWDIFWFRQRDDEDPRQAGLVVPVNLSTTKRNGEPRNPDTVVVVTDTQKVLQNEKTIGNLDTVTIVSADIQLIPRQKIKKNGEIKIGCYLGGMYVKVQVNDFDAPYEDLPWAE